MRPAKWFAMIALPLTGQLAQAQLLDGFEDGNMNEYTVGRCTTGPVTNPNHAFAQSSAHNGSLGLRLFGTSANFGPIYSHNTAGVGAVACSAYSVWVAVPAVTVGEFHMGLGDSNGGVSVALTPGGFLDIFSEGRCGGTDIGQPRAVPGFIPGQWYQLRMAFREETEVRAEMWDGSRCLAATPFLQLGAAPTGRIWFRGWASIFTDMWVAVDTIRFESGVDPIIIAQPQDAIVCPASTATFTVMTAQCDAGFDYQWMRNGVPLTDDEEDRIVGANTPTLRINRVRAGDDQSSYRVIIGNQCGQVMSEEAVLLLNENDADRDGLLDCWEVPNGGIDFDGDGELDYDQLDDLGADVHRRDLFIEVDLMAGIPATAQEVRMAINRVRDAFRNAPPDENLSGIEIHFNLDDRDLPFEDVSPIGGTDEKPGFPLSGVMWRENWFGELEERQHANREALLNAKALAFRYCVFINLVPHRAYWGLGETPGDEFVICTNRIVPPNSTKVESLAATFMHELGHTLGLDHGGSDGDMGKPNYPSVMNYAMSQRFNWCKGFWRLDYSRVELPEINENKLNEEIGLNPAGLGAEYYSNVRMACAGEVCNPASWSQHAVGDIVVTYEKLHPAASELGIDWNRNGELDAFDASCATLVRCVPTMPAEAYCISEDINYLAPLTDLPLQVRLPSPGQTLRGCNDWELIRLKVTDGGGYFAETAAPEGELSEAAHIQVEDFFPPPGAPCQGDPLLTRRPHDQVAAMGETVLFAADARSESSITFRWRRAGQDLLDGPTAFGSVISGAMTNTLTITNAQPGDSTNYDVVCASDCGEIVSLPASLLVGAVVPGDLDDDGDVDLDDLTAMLAAFGQCAGGKDYTPLADLDHDGCIGIADVARELNLYGA